MLHIYTTIVNINLVYFQQFIKKTVSCLIIYKVHEKKKLYESSGADSRDGVRPPPPVSKIAAIRV